MLVTCPDDLVSAVARDRRMAGYRVRRQGDGWIELEVVAQRARQPVLLVLAWPDVWRDPDALEPHLVRSRSGNYGLILVGTDAELDDTRLAGGGASGAPTGGAHDARRGFIDGSANDADLTALASP